jgi:hypothetical protein
MSTPSIRTKYQIDEDNRIKNDLERDFNNKDWFVTIKDIAPKTRMQLNQLKNCNMGSIDLNDLRNRNISFHKQIVDIRPLDSHQLAKHPDLLVGFYAYEACKFSMDLHSVGVESFDFDFAKSGFKYAMDDVSCFPIAAAHFQLVTIKNNMDTSLKILLLLAYLEPPHLRRKIMGLEGFIPEFQGHERSFIQREGMLLKTMI